MRKTWAMFTRRGIENMPLKSTDNQAGFTLVEMIGVLAVIAILVALVLPKVFEVIASSNAQALASAVRTYEAAVVNYYADIGSLLPLDANGVPKKEGSGNSATATSLPARLTLDASDSLNTGEGQWPKFRGPYLEKFDSTKPPGLGTAMYMPATSPVAYGTAVTASNLGWDLKGDDGKSDIPSNAYVVYLRVDGLTQEEFLRLDAILDKGVGTTTDTKVLRGRAKYDANNSRAYIYLAHG
ncbi:MAG: type II secretion system protein [Nitrospirae bacterium]|nr:MAG: type II secretion system protein [Nitrospirota bacterium]